MKVEVQLYATLRKYGPLQEGPLVVDLTEGDQVARVLEILGMPPDEDKVILVNGRPARWSSVLTEGDRVVLFPAVAGG
jgi:molybdopterin converting factor small subunit